MNNNTSNREIHLTAKQMQNYITGKLNDVEMHRIEKHMLECDFCAEAMEGLETLEDVSTFEPVVSKLKKRIEKRVQEPKKETKIVPLYKKALRIAAMLAVLIVASVLVTNYFKSDVDQKEFSEKKKTEAPKKEKFEKKEDGKQSILNNDSTLKPEVKKPSKKEQEKNKPKPEKEEPIIEKTIVLIDNEKQNKSDEDVTGGQAIVIAETEVEDVELISNESIDVFEDEIMEITADNRAIPARNQSRSMNYGAVEKTNAVDIPPLRHITGKVVTEDNKPLPYASIQVKNSDAGTIASEGGEFMLMMPEGYQTLIVSIIGFETKEIPVSNQDTLSIILRNDDALDAMTVTSVAITNQKKSDSKKKTTKPQPVDNKEYEQYLKDSLRYPKEAFDAEIKGIVMLQFTIEPNGNISNINVIKGLGYGCDQEAIRLLKEGPEWIPGNIDGIPIAFGIKLKIKFK